ncbi:MAG: nucleotidyltransferase family protein [Acutalibacteraceae bacterium]|nr:nucleotidyltransferase family protein [Acutalibacteraceae bacterium]
MHTHLFGEGHSDVFNEYYDNTMRLMLHDEDSKFGYHFSDEDFYVFMTAHEYKHYSSNGTGIRSLLDCYVYVKNKGNTLDWDYITEQCRQLEIADFEQKRRELAMKIFSSEQLPKLTKSNREQLEFYLMAGTYGNLDSMITSRIKNTGSKGLLGKTKYVCNRLFPPMETMREYYPQFFENKLLFPLLPFYRLSKIFTIRKEFVKSELKALINYKGNF